MNRGKTWPFEEGWPDKPDMIAEGSVADVEWTRICRTLEERRMLSPAWGGMILVAASAFEDMQHLEAAMAPYGRTEELAESHAACVAQYREACRDLLVDPDPSVILRPCQKTGG
jgi:hypothetical protein